MARPALTVALVLDSPALVESCRQWLPSNRYEHVVLSVPPGETLAAVLGPGQNDFDAVVMKTKQEQDEHLRKKYKKFKEERRKTQAEDNKKKAAEEKSLKDELRDLAKQLKAEEQQTA